MKYIKKYKIFENVSGEMKKKSIINKINNILDELNVDSLSRDDWDSNQYPNFYYVKLKNKYMLIEIEKKKKNIIVTYSDPNLENEEYKYEDIENFDIIDLSKIYEYFVNFTLERALHNYWNLSWANDVGKIYKKNWNKIDLNNMFGDGRNFFEICEENSYGIFSETVNPTDITDNYHFQKWAIENNPNYFEWFCEYGVKFNKKIIKEYPEIEAYIEGMGFFDLKTKE